MMQKAESGQKTNNKKINKKQTKQKKPTHKLRGVDSYKMKWLAVHRCKVISG